MASTLSEEMLRVIRGELVGEAKHAAYDSSLSSWWKEYAARKNDEEEEHVADSLLYDERCHLPRMVPAPDVVTRARNQADAPRTPEHPDTGVGENRPHDGSGGEPRPPPQSDKPQ